MRCAARAAGVLVGVLVLVAAIAASAATAAESGKYRGAAACAAPNCHGRIEPNPDGRVALQNEYTTWFGVDRHAKAFAVLRQDRALAIGRRLGLAQPPDQADRCLDCHALNVPEDERGPRFQLADGVSCEACHGPSGRWLKKHTVAGWEPRQSVELGMVETMDPGTAARVCLGCHFGDARRSVDHSLIAAGHPPLVFELDTFGTNMTPHWQKHPGNAHWYDGGAWAAGQATALRAAADALARPHGSDGWPEFSLYDCYTCHHELGRPGGWTLRGSAGRPPLDGSRWRGVAPLAQVIDPGRVGLVRAQIARLDALAAAGRRGEALQPTAAATKTDASAILASVRADGLDAGARARLLRELAATPDQRALGYRDAQQVAWAIDALATAQASARDTSKSPALDAAIQRLFDTLTSARAYDPQRFASALAGVRVALGNE